MEPQTAKEATLNTVRNRIACAALALLAAAPATLFAQGYPNRPIKYIVPFPPGGATDTLARAIGQKLSDALGQPVVIDNRPGAGGNIGIEAAVRAPADGYTIVNVATATVAINPSLYRNLSFDAGRDLVPVAFIAYVPNLLVVNPAIPANTLGELVAYLKANPGKVNFASPGSGNSSHLAGEMLKQRTGVEITHVPYKGDAAAFADLIGGQVQMMFAIAVTAVPHVKAGRLKGIAVAGLQRTPTMPDLPTMAEAGLPGFDAGAWFGISAPAGTPQPVIDKLSRAANEALKSDEVMKSLQGQTVAAIGGTPEAFRKHMEAEQKRWNAVVAAAGLRK